MNRGQELAHFRGQWLAPTSHAPFLEPAGPQVIAASRSGPEASGHAAELVRAATARRKPGKASHGSSQITHPSPSLCHLGIVASLNRMEQELVVSFEGRPVTYDYAELDELSLAYVLTIHKSQGSEYPCVVIPIHTQHYLMLRRNLLYTAVTRGKQLVVLVGTRNALQMAVSRQDTHRRYTALRRRLQ